MRVATLLTSLMLSACSTFGVRTVDQPPYTVEQQIGPVEIRSYGPRAAAETTIANNEVDARSDGFRKLAHYIFGGNAGQQSIAMTAPVAQSSESEKGQTIAMTAPVSQAPSGDSWTISFFLPATLTQATAPKPLDPSVRIVAVPSATMAVLRFTGSRDAEAMADHRTQLLAALQGSPWQPIGDTVNWFYDPPWTLPPLRRNEVAVEVRPRSS
jgi:hypothetical protein